jgi:hydrogenase maturation protein HypF
LTYRQAGQHEISDNPAALVACVDALSKGLIVAVKGVGGYHLLCDATDNVVVERLRKAKHRPAKPLAVLLPSLGADGLDCVREVADLDLGELDLLKSPLRPIVLMRKRQASKLLADGIAPGLREVGLMLAYSPLHHLLIDAYCKPLVATSANISGEPVLTEGWEVEQRLGQVADAFLHHNRPIRRPADDSVFRRIAGKSRPMRLGRGLAPVERLLPFELKEPLLALGADLKNTVAFGFGNRVVISPHIGDLGTVRSTEVFERVIADLQSLYAMKPSIIVCDAHPDYRSSRWARKQHIPAIKVFHHHAHASALAGEHGIVENMLVFTWDGVGFGEDRTLWGGEALLGRPGAWRRVASMRPFRLLGGDKANREPWRCGLALCLEAGIDWKSCPNDAELLRHAWERDINCPVSTSAGRLFDAAAALIGLGLDASFEGHAAMRLESLSESVDEPIDLPSHRDASGLWRADWALLLPMLMDDSLSIAERGSLFHASLARLICTQAINIRNEHAINKIGLSGGVFQNRLLTEQATKYLALEGFEVFLPTDIPANDAGLSYGQIIEVAAQT